MKKILYVILGIIVAIGMGIAALVVLVNPNQFKPMMAEKVKQETGYDLVIHGDIQWRFFPVLGLQLGETELKNPQGFTQSTLIHFREAAFSISVLPLLSQQLTLGTIRLDDADIFIETLKDGRSNLDGFINKSNTTHDTASSVTSPDESHLPSDEKATAWTLTLAGVALNDARAKVINHQTESSLILERLNVTLDAIAPHIWTEATFDVSGQKDTLLFSAKGQTELRLSSTYQLSELKNLSLSLSAKDGKQGLKHANVQLDHFKHGQWATATVDIDGHLPDVSIVTKGQTQLKFSFDQNMLSLENTTLNSVLSGQALPRDTMDVNIKANVTYDLTKQKLSVSQLKANADEVNLSGHASFVNGALPIIRFTLDSDGINADHWMASEPKPAAQVSVSADSRSDNVTDSPSATPQTQEPDLSILKQLDIDGTLALKQITISKAQLSDVQIALTVKEGVAALKKLRAQLYQGSLHASGQLNANTPLATYQFHTTLDQVAIKPLLADVANNQQLAGRGHITAAVSGKGLSPERMITGMAGTVDISLTDGAVYGVNISEMIRNAKARLKGQTLAESDKQKKTDFSTLTAQLQVGKGVAKVNDLTLRSPLLDIQGKGETDLIQQSLAFSVNTAIVASGKGLDELKGITVPIKIQGTWQQPTYQLDLKNLFKQNSELEQKAKKELNRGLEKLFGDKAKDEKIKNVADQLLKGLFN